MKTITSNAYHSRKYLQKKYLYSYMLGIFLLFLLSQPSIAAEGAKTGLMLWAAKLMPSLLPFLIITQLLILSGYLDAIIRKLHLSFPCFVLFCGILFGFPMGCKLTSDLLKQDKITPEEADILFPLCNHISPAFVGGYILSENLKRPELILPTYAILYLPSLLLGLWKLHVRKHHAHAPAKYSRQKKTPGLQMNFTILDASIMNSFETMLKLGGYIMLFSMTTGMFQHLLSGTPAISCLISCLLEITGAVYAVNSYAGFGPYVKYTIILAATAFGGISGIAQTAAISNIQTDMSANTTDSAHHLSMKNYIGYRLLLTVLTGMLAALIYPFFS